MSNRFVHTPEGRWLMAAAALPPGDYAWHRFRGRGYVALVGVVEVAQVLPVPDGGCFVRVAGFHWRALPASAPVPSGLPADGRWFPSLRAGIAAAGKLLAGTPFFRQEIAAAPPRRPRTAPQESAQAVLEF